MKKQIMEMAWTIYKNAGCTGREEFGMSLKIAHALNKNIPQQLKHLQIPMTNLNDYMKATGKNLIEMIETLGLDNGVLFGIVTYIRAPKAFAQREAMRKIEAAVKKAADKTDGIVRGRWIMAEAGWMVAIEGKGFEGRPVRVVKRNGQESIKTLICELPTEFGLLWEVA